MFPFAIIAGSLKRKNSKGAGLRLYKIRRNLISRTACVELTFILFIAPYRAHSILHCRRTWSSVVNRRPCN